MEGVLVCDQSNEWPVEDFFENLNAINMMGVKADERLGFGKDSPHHALKKGAAP